jgi:hypothetical protein
MFFEVPVKGSFLTVPDLTYLARYYEKRETSWKLRQTGVYHAYTQSSESHLFILLHPREDSIFQAELEKFVGDMSRTALLVARPLAVHELLFQSYIGNWRIFLRDKGSDFLRSVSCTQGKPSDLRD